MDLNKLTSEMNRFVRSKGWYEEDSPKPQSPRNLAISMMIDYHVTGLAELAGTRTLRRQFRAHVPLVIDVITRNDKIPP